MTHYDVAIIGGGIVGLATARAVLAQLPHARLVVLEKEAQVAMHQTGHNSGVLHSGIYYKPGSLKAQLCRTGRQAMLAFCAAHHIAYQPIGKLIVASTATELPALRALYDRGLANGVAGVSWLEPAAMRAIEPHAVGVGAVHCPETGILDYPQVCRALADDLTRDGAIISLGCPVLGVHETADGVVIRTAAATISANHLINCAGLYSDVIARWLLPDLDVQIIPFRGDYYAIRDPSFVRGLIYPVPDLRFPFLGVHLTRMIDGGLEAGPSAVLGFAREGYRMGTIRPAELWEIARFPGMWQVARRHWHMGLYEMYRALRPRVFLRSIQRLVPAIGARDIAPGNAGVRAQAVRRDGVLLDDFAFASTAHSLHVINAPSPAATASLAIGEYIADRVIPQLRLNGVVTDHQNKR